MNGVISSLAEGGQTWAHRIRMLRQVLKIIMVTSVTIFLITICFSLFWDNHRLLIAAYYHVKATVISFLGEKIQINPYHWKKIVGTSYGSQTLLLSTQKVLLTTKPLVYNLIKEVQNCLALSIKTSLLSSFCMAGYFLKRGLKSKKKKQISGTKVTSPLWLRWKLKILRESSPFTLGKIPFVKDTETMHTLITGGTGSGKTNCLHHLISSIRKNNSKAIIIDTTGSFVSRYYREGKDIILNPFDTKNTPWSPWSECNNRCDYEELAESFIPKSTNSNEDYWRSAARSLFSSLLQKLKSKQKTSELVHWCLYSSLKELAEFVEGTKAASHIDISSEKTAGSVRSVASSFLDCLENLDDTKTPFSIKEWIKKEDDSFLFLASKPSQRASISPLISSWISLGVRGLLDLEPSRNRKIWFILDELPTLNKVKGIETLLTEGRKYGGCAVLALQSPSQLESIYGRNVALTLSGNCATKVVFSENDPETAEKISKIFGTNEIGEFNEGISYGANEVRDGVTLSYQKKKEAAVSASDIQLLKPNNAFIRLAGKKTLTKMKFQINA